MNTPPRANVVRPPLPVSLRLPEATFGEGEQQLSDPEDSSVIECDIAIIGGGLGGVAAALSIGRRKRVALFEETAMLGGQITAQGVSALDEHAHIERFGAPPVYDVLRRRIRRHYQQQHNAPAVMAHSVLGDHMPLNPGNGWVSRLCFDPRVGRAIIEDLIAQHDQVHVYMQHTPIRAKMDGDQITAIVMHDQVSGREISVHAQMFIDATELGDLLPLTHTPYVTGAEAHADTGEPHAAATANPNEIQSFTMCFAVEFCAGENHTITKPEGYEYFRDQQPYTLSPRGRDGQAVEYKFFETSAEGNLPFWTYRRIHDGALLGGNDIALINWVSNDYHAASIIDVSPDERARVLDEAKRLSLGFLYWLQTECPRDDGGVGYPELKLRPDVMMTADGLAAYPYIREARRILPITRIVEQDITSALNPGARARLYPDAVGVGWYALDLHPCVGNPDASMYAPTKPFQIPLGALIPRVGARNLIAACKNIGTTHLTNGAYRLHPVECAIGEAAGALAQLCVETNMSPAEVHADHWQTWRLQKRILDHGGAIFWVFDHFDNQLGYATKHYQLLLVRGILAETSPLHDHLSINPLSPIGLDVDLDKLHALTAELNRHLPDSEHIDSAHITRNLSWGELAHQFAAAFAKALI